MKLINFLLVSVSLSSHFSYGYEIGKKSIENLSNPEFGVDRVFSFSWEKNHEKLTALALQCLADLNKGEKKLSKKPEFCFRREVTPEDMSLFNGGGDYPSSLDRYRLLLKTVRWPDDPTRQVYDDSDTSIKFAGTIKSTCKARIKKSPNHEIVLAADGLLCAGHYGKFQFLHSMATKDGVEPDITYKKITDWSKFAYLFSLNEINHGEKYCAYWDENSVFPFIKDAFQVEAVRSRGWCNEREIGFFDRLFNRKLWGSDQETYPAWTISTIFSFHCDRFAGSDDCTIVDDLEEVNFSALGSILHLIQDSYSLSHTNRGGAATPAEVNCSEVKNFYSYYNQNTDKHSTADKWPEFSKTCNVESSGTLDPITASAQIIWLHANGEKDAGKVSDIIGLVYGNLEKSGLSMPGEQYK